MNCSTCLVLVIAFFTLLAHAEDNHNDVTTEKNDTKNIVTEKTVTAETPMDGGDEGKDTDAGNDDTNTNGGDQDTNTNGEDEDTNTEDVTEAPLNGSHTSCGSLSLAVGVMVISRWIM